MPSFSFDIFCHVIDNFGDIGVTWRLARQLSREFNCKVRFIINDLQTFQKFVPELSLSEQAQNHQDITILHWSPEALKNFYGNTSQVVIEGFGCQLPALVLERMKQSTPVWIDLEYLSAEEWVSRFHGILSCHPETSLDKTFFFPGFKEDTGGLLRERDLLSLRDEFQGDLLSQNKWRRKFGIPECSDDTLDISLFCYQTAPVSALVNLVKQSDTNVRLLLTAGISHDLASSLEQLLKKLSNKVSIHILPFLSQHDYDRLLWASTINFVRGEDSFSRAIWARRPFIWQIYPQENDVHLKKLRAFLELYLHNFSLSSSASLEKFTILWNSGATDEGDVSLLSLLPLLSLEAKAFTDTIATRRDLASTMFDFIKVDFGKPGLTP